MLGNPPCGDTGTAYTELEGAGYSLELPDCKHPVPPPLWTLDALNEGSEKLKIMYVGPSNNGSFPASAPLAPFKGEWVQAVEHITYGTGGKYGILITRIRDGHTPLS